MDDTKDETLSSRVPERRKQRRYRWSVPVEISTSDSLRIRGITIEISEGGFSAAISAPLKAGDRVVVTPQEYSAILAVVRWVRGRAYGFEFVELDPEQQQRIRNECQMLPLYISTLDF